jgi:hypothetical protein
MANSGFALRYSELWKPAWEIGKASVQPKYLPLLVPGLKSLFPKGLKRGSVTEVNGCRSSGRTSVTVHILAQATKRGEICAVIDLYNGFDPNCAAAAGVRLDRLVWVRCSGNIEHAVRAADLLVHAGGFGLVLLDLCEANARMLQRIPLSYWYRFRRAVEHTPAILLVCADTSQAKSCSSNSVCLKPKHFEWRGRRPFLLLRGLEASATVKAATPAPSRLSMVSLSQAV